MEISPFIQGLPKVELHLHIEGTLEPDLKHELAQRNGIKVEDSSAQSGNASYDIDDLVSFLAVYYDGMNVLQKAEDFYDLAMAYFRKVADQNLRYAEIFFDPQAHTSRGVPFHSVITGLRRAQIEAEQKLGITSGLIMCFLREFQEEYAMATLLEALPYRAWILGIGLDSDENGNPPAKFERVYARAKAEGFMLTAHCDVDIPNSIEHIRQAIEQIGVARIDHGTNIVEDPRLLDYIVKNNIGLTTCPISNKWVSDGSKVELIKELHNCGVKITINSDDPAYFGGYIAENFQVLADEGNASNEFLGQCSLNAVDISWAPTTLKVQLREEIEQYMKNDGASV